MRVISPPRLITLTLSAVLLAMLLAVPHQTARAFSIIITDTDDDNTVNGNCTLREAIIAANTNAAVDECPAGDAAATDVITLQSFEIYDLLLASTNENASADGDLDIIDNAGAATDLIITTTGSGYANVNQFAGDDRVFHILSGTVEFEGIVISGGSVPAGFGGGINNAGTLTLTNSLVVENSAPTGFGGGISTSGTLNIIDSTIGGNTASGGFGGGINASGILTITGSTFSGNSAAGAFGGDINNAATMVIANSTFDGGSASFGGSIYNVGTATIINATITGGAASFGGGINNAGGTLTLTNSIVAQQFSGTDCAGTITSGDNNIESGTSCGFTQTNDQQNTDPLLGPLQYNGGPTDTRALSATSPAIDAGNNTVCSNAPVGNVDQRGLDRSTTPTCDVGAFERQPVDLIVTKENDTFNGTAYVDVPLSWIITIENIGDEELVIPSGTPLFIDTLSLDAVDYDWEEGFSSNISGTFDCSFTEVLPDWNEFGCITTGTGFTIGGGGYVEIIITLTPTATGTMNNPTGDGGICRVDYEDAIEEGSDENNDCEDSVEVAIAPDLVAVKTNDTGGVAEPGETFNWIKSGRRHCRL